MIKVTFQYPNKPAITAYFDNRINCLELMTQLPDGLQYIMFSRNGIEIRSRREPSLQDIINILDNFSGWDVSTDPLDLLAREGTPGLPWVCRESTTGRGLRLHQVSPDDFSVLYGLSTYPTPHEAVEAFLAARIGLPPLKEVPSQRNF